jgi:hypothetical protein
MHVEWVDNEAVVLDPDNGQLHYLNPPAALVFAFIQEHGYEAGMDELEKRHGAEPGFREQLPELLEDMVKKGLLIDD